MSLAGVGSSVRHPYPYALEPVNPKWYRVYTRTRVSYSVQELGFKNNHSRSSMPQERKTARAPSGREVGSCVAREPALLQMLRPHGSVYEMQVIQTLTRRTRPN